MVLNEQVAIAIGGDAAVGFLIGFALANALFIVMAYGVRRG